MSTDTPSRILVVDDSEDMRDLVSDLLQRHQIDAFSAENVEKAESLLKQNSFDLIILDVMMPGEDGTSFCHRLRRESDIPILMVSALGESTDRIIGLELGADDYLAKPFNPRELIARMKALLRRAPRSTFEDPRSRSQVFVFDRFHMNIESRELSTSEGPVDLTSGEFTLLMILVESAPRILSRDQLLDLTRGASGSPFDRSIDTHISRLRQKIESDPRRPTLIKTVRNLGYGLAAKVERKLS